MTSSRSSTSSIWEPTPGAICRGVRLVGYPLAAPRSAYRLVLLRPVAIAIDPHRSENGAIQDLSGQPQARRSVDGSRRTHDGPGALRRGSAAPWQGRSLEAWILSSIRATSRCGTSTPCTARGRTGHRGRSAALHRGGRGGRQLRPRRMGAVPQRGLRPGEPALVHYEDLFRRPEPHYVIED